MYLLNRALGWYYSARNVLRPRTTADRVVIGSTDQGSTFTVSIDAGGDCSPALAVRGCVRASRVEINGAAPWITLDEATTSPSVTDLDAADSVTMYMTNNQLVFAHNCGGAMRYLSITLDGLSCTWVQKSGAP